jgi:hypothetical protein
MLEKLVMLASYGYNGGQIGDFLNALERAGFFAYALPFLLIFALVTGILTKVKIFKDTPAMNGIIALAVSLMALQYHLVPEFFSVIFPKLGVALSIILVLLILIGMFLPDSSWVDFVLMGIAAIIVIVVLVQSAGDVGWRAGYWWYDNWPMVAGVVVFLIMIAVIVGGSKPKQKPAKAASKFLRDLFD